MSAKISPYKSHYLAPSLSTISEEKPEALSPMRYVWLIGAVLASIVIVGLITALVILILQKKKKAANFTPEIGWPL